MEEKKKRDLASATNDASPRESEFAEITDDDLAGTTGGCGCGSAACASVVPNNAVWPPR